MIFKSVVDLPFDNIFGLDFEFYGTESGNNPKIVCLVVENLRTNEISKYWFDKLNKMKDPPFPLGSQTLIVTFFGSVEFQCMQTLKWETNFEIIDLFAEFRCLTNGDQNVEERSLIYALKFFGLHHLIPQEKEQMRDLILSGGPWTDVQKKSILEYCQQDVVALFPLLNAILSYSPWDELYLNQALLRGRYTKTVGVMQFNGVPIDRNTLEKLESNWAQIKLSLVEEINKEFKVFDGISFRENLFEKFLTENRLKWKRLRTGRLALDRQTFSDMSKKYPQIRPLHELRKTLSELTLNKLSVSKEDDRNRTLLSPFATKTGRNAPSTNRFIFGPAKWMRSLIKPKKGMALAYCDWRSQEIAIAGALSNDTKLWNAYSSNDPYINFAVQAKLAPEGATKKSHKKIRNNCKSVVLGSLYGMTAFGISQSTNLHFLEAQNLLQKHRETYRDFWSWAENNINVGLLGLKLETCFGWSIKIKNGDAKGNTFLNFPMQSTGAEMLRLACILAIENGLKVCAPIHDALLLESHISKIDEEVLKLKSFMGDASEAILGSGKRCGVDAEIIKFPCRFMDEQGQDMWNKIMKLLSKIEKSYDKKPEHM